MIGLVVVTHGRLAVELIAALEHVVGPQSAVRTICIGPDDDMEKRRKDHRFVIKTKGKNKIWKQVRLSTAEENPEPSGMDRKTIRNY